MLQAYAVAALNQYGAAGERTLRQFLLYLFHIGKRAEGVADAGKLAAHKPHFLQLHLFKAGHNALMLFLAVRAQFAHIELAKALHSLLPYNSARRLDREAPTHLSVPSGSDVRIDYLSEAGPVLAVKLQEMFGQQESPAVCGGRCPVLVHLLSPAGRPLQVTRDLAGFWRTGYAAVRAEMRGRYPKHPWPEDPLTAIATKKTNKALARG